MARACRRFTAGERATASHARIEPRRNRRKTMRCVKGPTSRTNRQVKRKQNLKYLRAMRLLVAPTTSECKGVGGGGRGAGAGGPVDPRYTGWYSM